MTNVKNCENDFCVYWESGCCILGQITMDGRGNCEDCIYIDFDEDTLQKKRVEYLWRDADWKG